MVASCKKIDELSEFIAPCEEAFKLLTELSTYLQTNGMKDPEIVGAVASEYLNVFGYATFAFSWLSQARAALELGNEQGATKLKLARFFFRHVFPEIQSHAAIVRSGKDAIMDFAADEF